MNPLTLNPLQIKLALVGIGLAFAAMSSLMIWALLERNGRLDCKIDLVRTVDQVDVLVARLEDQSKSIDDLAAATRNSREAMRGLVGQIGLEHQATRKTVAELERQLKAPTGRRADGSLKDCRDAIREWREERTKK